MAYEGLDPFQQQNLLVHFIVVKLQYGSARYSDLENLLNHKVCMDFQIAGGRISILNNNEGTCPCNTVYQG